MTPLRALIEIVDWCWFLGGACRSEGARAYVLSGKEIPDQLLPGRHLQRHMRDPAVATAIRNLTSRAAMNISRWEVKRAVESTPTPRTWDR